MSIHTICTNIHTLYLTRHKLERVPTIGDVCMIRQRLRKREYPSWFRLGTQEALFSSPLQFLSYWDVRDF